METSPFEKKLKLALGGALLTLGVFVFTLARNVMYGFYVSLAYYLIWALLLAWAWALARYLRKLSFSPRAFLSRNWLGLTLTLALTTAIFLSVKPGWRVLSDDTNLLGLSRSMLFQHKPLNPTMGYFYYDNLNIKNQELEKRPLLFPFMAHLIHLASGYRPANMFALNFLVAWCFLFLFYRVFEPHTGPPGGMAAALILASYPIFSLNATGGGYDLFSALFLALSLQSAWLYLRNPETEELDLLWFNLLMLANIRYETIVYLFIVFGVLAAFRRLHDIRRIVLLALCSAPLFLPMLWQRLLTLGKYEQPVGTALFRLSSFLDNIGNIVRSQVDFTLPFDNIVNIAALIALEAYVIHIIDRKEEYRTKLPFLVMAVSASGFSLLVNCAHFFLGSYSHSTGARLYLPFAAACAFAVPAFLALRTKISGRVQLAGAALLFAFYHPIAMERRLSNNLVLVRTTNQIYEQLREYGNKNILIITERPGQYTVMGYGAVSFKYANENAVDVLNSLNRRLFTEILVIQEITFANDLPKQGQKLVAAYGLEPVWEIENSESTLLRISLVNKESRPPSGDGAL